MKYASEIMHHDPVTVSPSTPVAEFATLLLEHGFDGMPVVDQGKVVGVVTSMDLIFQEKRVHVPSFFAFLEAVQSRGGRTSDLDKVTGSCVRDIMTADPVTVSYDTELAEIASLMVDHHISTLPVLNHGRLVGVITKRDVLWAAFGSAVPDEAETVKVPA